MTILLLSLFALQSVASAASGVPLTFSQPEESIWAVAARGQGTVSVSGPDLDIRLSELTLEANPKTGKTAISQLRACIAYNKPNNAWDTASCSLPMRQRVKLAVGKPLVLHDVRFKVPVVKTLPLKLFWLVLMIEMPPGRENRYQVYSFSQGDPLSALEERLNQSGR